MNVGFANTSLPDVLELRDVSQSYDNDKTFVIKNLHALIEQRPKRGKCVAILGKSGCGKSTLLRYLSGLQKPSCGQVFINGQPRRDAHRIGMVFQQYSSLPWLSVFDNVQLGLEFRGLKQSECRALTKDMIATVGLSGHEGKYAQYPTLSGGQLQRVAIARSLVTNPEILLMDEPFGALDTETRLSMQDFLISIWVRFQNTILFVTHDIHEAVYISDEIWIMSSGPGEIVDRISVEGALPYERTRSLKREKRFVEIVYSIEDKLAALTGKAKLTEAGSVERSDSKLNGRTFC